MTMEAPNGSWIGIGFGTQEMGTDNDMIMCSTSSSGECTCYDMTSTGNQAPAEDSTSNISTTTSTSQGGALCKVTRDLDTSDADDYVLPLNTEFDIIWATNLSSTSVTDKHETYGDSFVTIKSDGTKTSVGEDEADWHVPTGAMNTVASTVLYITLLTLATY